MVMSGGSPASDETVTGNGGDGVKTLLPHQSGEDSSAKTPEDKSAKRRAHRKSRYGCRNCKGRRIKCDETKPECGNCKHRQVRCDYLHASAPSSIQTPNSEANTSSSVTASPPQGLNIQDAELMYHWTTSTYNTISTHAYGGNFWRSNVTELGFSHECVLRLIFAITALHLAYCRPDRYDEYVARADHHYAVALRSVTASLPNINEENSDAVLISVRMACFVTWARRPQPGEYLAFGQSGRSEWLIMFRGVRTTFESIDTATVAKAQIPYIYAKANPLPRHPCPPAYEEPLAELEPYIQNTSEPADLATNLFAHSTLVQCYNDFYGGLFKEYHFIFAWLYRMEDEFLEAMQRHEPVPLVLFAYFVVLMHHLEEYWYMKGWTAHVFSGIWSFLDEKDKVWVRWPISTVGWIPP